MLDKTALIELIDAAISSDALSEDGQCGFVRVMARGRAVVRADIASAFELYGLLRHFAESLPWYDAHPTTGLVPGIYGMDGGVLALVPVGPRELADIVHWVADGLRNEHVKQRAGVLVLAFALEQHDGRDQLIPEWWSAFYVNSSPLHCVPLLALRSALDDHRIGQDWVKSCLHRMQHFDLPTEHALAALADAVSLHNRPTPATPGDTHE